MSHITSFTRIGLWLLLSALTGILLISTSAYLYLSPSLPSVAVLKDIQLQTPLRVYSSDKQLIGEFGEKRRRPIDFDQIPTSFVNAIMAAEDNRFYDHHGVDIKGLLRAVSQLLLTGEKGSGGSTITMQVARNYFLSFEKTFSRKFNEILLSLQIERELSKAEILELYVNKIFLGNRAYGIEAAAQVYYGKSIGELNLPQLAMIAGLPKAPSSYNPLINPARALSRRNWILGRMLELGYINQHDHTEATNSLITASYHGKKLALDAPHIAEMVRQEMLQRYGRRTYTDGYSVYTTINSQFQAAAQQAVTNGLMAYDKRHGYRGPEQNILAQDDLSNHQLWAATLAKTKTAGALIPAIVTTVHEQAFNALLEDGSETLVDWSQGLKNNRPFDTANRLGPNPKVASDIVAVGDLIRLKKFDDGNWQLSQLPAAQAALVSIDASNGSILSLVGGFNYNQSKFNRITQATRQPGSNFKPFIYTAALANGYTPASIINDAPIVFEDAGLESTWRPTNDGGKFYGPTRLRHALFKSRNLVSIRLLRGLGITKAINYVQRFGFEKDKLPRDLSLALGSHSLTPLQIVSGYSTLANGGYKIHPFLIQQITNINGEALFSATPDTVCLDCNATPPNTEQPEPEITKEMATLEDILNQASPDEEPHTEQIKHPEAERVIEERVAYIIDSMLRDVIKKGTGRRARSLGRDDLAGKTGTTNGPTDAWFSGYGGGIATTAWLGFDKNNVLGRKEYGGSAALPIWIDYMKVALANRPESKLIQPEGIVTVKIDPTTGLLAKPGQRNAIFEIFRTELAPTQEADYEVISSDNSQLDEVMEEDIF